VFNKNFDSQPRPSEFDNRAILVAEFLENGTFLESFFASGTTETLIHGWNSTNEDACIFSGRETVFFYGHLIDASKFVLTVITFSFNDFLFTGDESNLSEAIFEFSLKGI
jgi:hypothetical protein